jgi:hypothetical protein
MSSQFHARYQSRKVLEQFDRTFRAISTINLSAVEEKAALPTE